MDSQGYACLSRFKYLKVYKWKSDILLPIGQMVSLHCFDSFFCFAPTWLTQLQLEVTDINLKGN